MCRVGWLSAACKHFVTWGRGLRVATQNVFSDAVGWPARRTLLSHSGPRAKTTGRRLAIASRWPIRSAHEVDVDVFGARLASPAAALLVDVEAPRPDGVVGDGEEEREDAMAAARPGRFFTAHSGRRWTVRRRHGPCAQSEQWALSFSGDQGDYISQGDSYAYSTSDGDALNVSSSTGSTSASRSTPTTATGGLSPSTRQARRYSSRVPTPPRTATRSTGPVPAWS